MSQMVVIIAAIIVNSSNIHRLGVAAEPTFNKDEHVLYLCDELLDDEYRENEIKRE